ncbi:Cysteine-rich motor neuron 1 protein [Amphibalanus amphitrite]|uniref:Cysteine-rich motor neuron 1 protein n=1 Tax=Amphibalanus amphitrite TaxID=1232801 RepID=A0A6A4VD75_AMPAM|nr:Cysteine-rich motor neuron 1 protein [Amphibalanus amphitrite]
MLFVHSRPSPYSSTALANPTHRRPSLTNCCSLLPPAAAEPSCPGVHCDPGVSSCPSDSVLKTVSSEQAECCPPAGICLCDLESCPRPPTCPEGHELSQLTKGRHKPGFCCNTWECKATVSQANLSCTHEGREYGAGERWQSNLCTSCQCKNGLTFCQSAECPPVAHCAKTTHDPDQCCPRCVDGCLSPSGEHHNVSEQWLEDDCTTCSCEAAGQPRCVSEMCHISCRNPRRVPGRCCAVCDECDVMCQHGYRTSRDGTPLCECLTADEVEHNVQGCRSMATCKKACPHGFKVDEDGCERCKCKKCRKLKDCNKTCPFGFETNDRACPICKCRSEPTVDEDVTSDPGSAGDLHCVTQDGREYEEGEQWHDGCRQCYCHGGVEMCAVISCPVPRCERPEIAEGQCCPTCPDGVEHPALLNVTVCQSVDGRTYVEGQTWQLDSCTRCLCHVGRVLCSAPSCPPAPCAEPVRTPGGCCGTCSAETDHQVAGASCLDAAGAERSAGESWRQSSCVSCVCRDGEVACFHERCPPLDCVRPVLKKDHCCPVCLEPPPSSHCIYKNRTISDGDAWDVDPCTSCVCQHGQTICTRKTCSVQCDDPVEEAGQCCPVCKEESGTKRNYHLMSGVSKATHRTVVRGPEGGSQTAHHGVERQPGGQQATPSYIALWAVIGLLALLLLALLVVYCARRHRNGYSPKEMTEEKKPLNDLQVMRSFSNGRDIHQDVLEKTGVKAV